jgi:hypothetical protein
VSASLPSNEPGAENRRSTRVIHAVPITVRSTDALGQPFEEFTSTVTVNCNGCKYESKHYVPKGAKLTVEIGARQRGTGSKIFPARVVWVQRPRTYREIFHIAVEFEIPGNVWDIKSPPKDWFPHPDDEELVVPVYLEGDEPETFAVPVAGALALAHESETAADMYATSHGTLTAEASATVPSKGSETVIHPVSSREKTSELEAARQMVRSIVEAAMTQDMTMLSEHLESQLQESVREAVSSFSQRIAEHVVKAVAEQATDRTTAIVAEARATSGTNVDELDEKIRLAAQAALGTLQEIPRKLPPSKRRRKSPK